MQKLVLAGEHAFGHFGARTMSTAQLQWQTERCESEDQLLARTGCVAR